MPTDAYNILLINYLMQRDLFLPVLNIRILILIFISTMMLRPLPTQMASFLAIRTVPTSLSSQPAFLLELAPSLHRDLRWVELSFVFNTCFLGLFASSLSSVTPWEIIKLPECIGWENEIPDRKRQQVYSHPNNIWPPVSSKDDENGRETKDQA